jgi:hypothetical protein
MFEPLAFGPWVSGGRSVVSGRVTIHGKPVVPLAARKTDSRRATAAKRVKATYPFRFLGIGSRKQSGATRKGASGPIPVGLGDSFDDGNMVRKDKDGVAVRKVTVSSGRVIASPPCYATPSTSDVLTRSRIATSERSWSGVRASQQGLIRQSQGRRGGLPKGGRGNEVQDDRVVVPQGRTT